MKVCAVITEYNPFHAGHLFQIREILRRMPDCCMISIMSGCFVQRGEPALWDKYFRASCAIRAGGPDLVLELPISAALSSAEGFAEGGVRLAASLGCVTHLSFGCESGTEQTLMQLAQWMDKPIFAQTLREHLASGISYAQAAQQTAQTLCPELAPLLASPNDLLAVQYCRAIRKYCPHIQPIAVRRIGAAHDGTPIDNIPSASYIRAQFHAGTVQTAMQLLPPEYREPAVTARRHSWQDLAPAVLPYLRRLTPEYIAQLPGVSEGLEHRFYAACQVSQSLEELCERTRSRRHLLSRVRRLTLCAYLGLTQDIAAAPLAFITVLGMNARGQQVLKAMKKTCPLPVIVKPTQARKLSDSAQKQWNFTVHADDLYYFPSPAGQDWKQTPYIEKPL